MGYLERFERPAEQHREVSPRPFPQRKSHTSRSRRRPTPDLKSNRQTDCRPMPFRRQRARTSKARGGQAELSGYRSEPSRPSPYSTRNVEPLIKALRKPYGGQITVSRYHPTGEPP